MVDIVKNIEKHKIIAILRGIDSSLILNAAKALYKGGIRILEVTFAQHNKNKLEETATSIRLIKEEFGDRIMVGAGTVLSRQEVDTTLVAGGEFVLSAVTDVDVISYSKSKGLGVIPGALTPTEILTAYNSGADLVKLFPAGDFGIDYIKSVTAPLSHIPLIVVGGINTRNICEFLSTGIKGAGIGSNLVNSQLIKDGNLEKITQNALEYINIINNQIN